MREAPTPHSHRKASSRSFRATMTAVRARKTQPRRGRIWTATVFIIQSACSIAHTHIDTYRPMQHTSHACIRAARRVWWVCMCIVHTTCTRKHAHINSSTHKIEVLPCDSVMMQNLQGEASGQCEQTISCILVQRTGEAGCLCAAHVMGTGL